MKRILYLIFILGLALCGSAKAENPITLNDAMLQSFAGYSYAYIATAGTNTVKTGSGNLVRLVVEGGTAGTIIIYDNTAASGTIMASFDSTNALATYTFDIPYSTGLTIITSANTKLTLVYS